MMYSISTPVLKTSGVIILYGLLSVIFLHVYRKKFDNIGIAFFLALGTGFVAVLSLYRFRPMNWYIEAKSIVEIILKDSKLGSGLLFSPIVVGLVLIFLGDYFSEKLSKQEYRSFYHSIYGIMVVSVLAISPEAAFIFLSLSLFLLLLAEYLRKSDDKSRVTLYVKKVLNKPLRSYETRGYVASFSYIGGMIIIILFLPQQYALASALLLSLGDPAAALVGLRFGKNYLRHNPDKSLEGSLAMLIVGIISLKILGLPLLLILFSTTTAVLFESLQLRVSDNLMIPIMSGIVMLALG